MFRLRKIKDVQQARNHIIFLARYDGSVPVSMIAELFGISEVQVYRIARAEEGYLLPMNPWPDEFVDRLGDCDP